MKPLLIHMLETLTCSGVLLTAYAVLLERRVRFRWCRVYLLVAMLLSGVIPLLDIPVWPGEVILLDPQPSLPDVASVAAAPAPEPWLTPVRCVRIGHALGALFVVGIMCWQIVRIRRLRRGAEICVTDRYTVVRTLQKISSFSFFRSIYVWRQTPEREMRTVVAHEASHVRHRHSLERIAMEMIRAAMWWNPFVWIAARRLTEVEEFEADSDVLDSGCDVAEYMHTIFKQMFGYSPEIANSLRDSLTKKRFRMMTMQHRGRYGLLRLAGTLPAVIGLVCAFSLTTKAAEIRIPNTEQTLLPTAPAPSAPDDERPYFMAETMPRFEGGNLNDFRAWVQARLRYPAEAMANKLQGRVVVRFVVERDGTVSNVEIVQSPGTALSDEVRRVVESSSGKWSSGMQKGEKVRVIYTLPVAFELTGSGEEPSDVAPIEQSGKVTDVDGRPVVGATVVVRGTQLGTTTSPDGTFSLKVPHGSMLEISYVGQNMTCAKADGIPLSVVLLKEGPATVDEVIAVGFGQQ